MFGPVRRGPLHHEDVAPQADLVAYRRHTPQALGQIASQADRLSFIAFADNIEHFACFGAPPTPQTSIAAPHNEGRQPITLVLDFAYDFFKHIFERDNTFGAAIFVHHDSQVMATLLKTTE